MKLTNLYEHFPAPVWYTDPEGNYIYVNKSWLSLTGVKNIEELVDWWRYNIHPDDVEGYFRGYTESIKALKPLELEFRLHCHGGDYKWMRQAGAPVYEENEYKGYIGYLFDETRSKQVEFELLESSRRYKSLYDNAQVGLYRTRISDGKVDHANLTMAQMFGYENLEEFMNEFISVNHYVDKGTREKMLEDLKNNGEVKGFDARFRRKDGSKCWLRYTAKVSCDKSYIEGVILDISDEKAGEEEIRKLYMAVEQSSSQIVITDALGYIEYVNPKFTAATGYLKEEVIGKNPRIIKSDEMQQEEYGKLWETISSGGEWRGEFRNKKKNGEIYWASASISPIRDWQDTITHYIAIQEDITDRKRTEELLQYQAYHDALTGLPNRMLFRDRLSTAIEHANRQEHKLAVMFLDLDRFKLVNDTLGHAVGDMPLGTCCSNRWLRD